MAALIPDEEGFALISKAYFRIVKNCDHLGPVTSSTAVGAAF